MKNKNQKKLVLFIIILFSILIGGISFYELKGRYYNKVQSGQGEQSSNVDFYSSRIQKIFDSRCVACHGCYESPCQLNLQSYEGLERGVHLDFFFERNRKTEALPTRLFEDTFSLQEWRKRGFKDILGREDYNKANFDPAKSILVNSVSLNENTDGNAINNYPEHRQCLNVTTEDLETKMKNTSLRMPYNFPSLEKEDIQAIYDWVKMGAPAPAKQNLIETDSNYAPTINKWIEFLNLPGYKQQLTSRYIYEHLYLAHLYFKDSPRRFYRLIRSSTSCDNPSLIGTRTPNDDPGVDKFYYCIIKFDGTVVNKNHLPYEINLNKLTWIKRLFIEPKWEFEQGWEVKNSVLPPYKKSINTVSTADVKDKKNAESDEKLILQQNEIASNPFVVFKDIPQESRYRFLLEDAFYHISTFTKGTSCNGTISVNAVQDHFFVLFMSPDADSKLNNWNVLSKYTFPGRYGKSVELSKFPFSYLAQTNSRNKAREVIRENLRLNYPNGLPIETIWNGDQNIESSNKDNEMVLTHHNPNAVLTIFRHNESASVSLGPIGDMPKTVFVMDYNTFERMSYDLVINFDIFGVLGHMLLTRVYMGLIRTDAEDNYLNFFPADLRIKLKEAWYNNNKSSVVWKNLKKPDTWDSLGHMLLNKIPLVSFQQNQLYKEQKMIEAPSGSISDSFFDTSITAEENHLNFMKKILFSHLGSKIIGAGDPLNWKKLKSMTSADPIESQLSMLTVTPQNKQEPFVYFFPESSYIILGITNSNGKREYKRFYSLTHNRQFNSISLMVGEDLHHIPEFDNLVLSPKVIGYYPNQFFYIEMNDHEVKQFVQQALAIRSYDTYSKFLNTYGVKRTNREVWSIYDFIVKSYLQNESVEAGYLDLSRYCSFSTQSYSSCP